MATTILCPNCKKTIEITEALKKHIESEVERDLTDKFQKDLEKARQKIEEQIKLEREDLKKELQEKEAKLVEFRKQELKLREEKRRLEEREKDLELEFNRRFDSEKQKFEETILKHFQDEQRLKDLEKEKVINDLKKSLEEMQRKASQGSQQSQGEILELDIENLLRTNFPNDAITEVQKGTVGADIKQIVKSPRGIVCGVILWELKRTKAWSDSWIAKLKTDLRSTKANISVIVSQMLPEEAKSGIGLKDGVWVIGLSFVVPLAILLRQKLLDVAYQKAVQMHQGDKKDLLYEYITGHEFRQQIEALVEVYNEMNLQITKERVSFEKSWKQREMQIKKLVMSTANVYGSMQGVVGSSMPTVRGLDLFELEDGK